MGREGEIAIDGVQLELVAEFLSKGSWTVLITRDRPAPEVQRIIRAVIAGLADEALSVPNPFTMRDVLANAEQWLAKLRGYQARLKREAT